MHKKKSVFLVSRYSDDIYKFIVNQCYQDLPKKERSKIEIENIKQKKIPDIGFLIYCLFCLLRGDLFDKEKVVALEYKKIKFGKHLLSFTFRNYSSYLTNINYFYTLCKNIYIVAKFFKTADFYIKNYNFKYVYLDHIEYLNAVYYQKFINNNKKIYTNRHPRGIIKTKKKNVEKLFEIKYKKIFLSKSQKNKIIKKSKKIFTSLENYLPWMYYTKYNSIDNKDYKKFEYIIYAHSFTDSQLEHQYDGFANTLEWLVFTVNELKKKKINFIIKAHPNFYLKSKIKGLKEISDWDKKIYKKYIENISKDKNILVIDKPVLNYDLVKKLDKNKCVVITKHGSVQLEMTFHNFKVITSKSNFIDPKYNLTNRWSNRNEYKNLLRKHWSQLKFGKEESFCSVMQNLFLDDNMAYGKNFYLNALKSHMSKLKLINKDSSYEKMITKFNSLKNKDRVLKKIDFPIKEV